MATVRFTHVQKIYANGFVAVRDFSLDIRDRELIVLVGPSGCGKSTTMRMVAGLEEVSEGTVEIGGRVVNRVPPKDRNVAMVFQDYALYPHMTVEENMSLGLRLKKVPAATIHKTVNDTAATLGLTSLLGSYPRQLSGGQRQRVALGRAIVRTPDVFMFDEPLSNLDPKLRTTMRVEIKKLHQRLAATMIYVTHDQTEAMTLGDRIVVLDRGVMQQVADPISLYERPANQFVAGFIGTPPMNFFACELEEQGGAFLARSPHLRLRLPERDGLDARLRAGAVSDRRITLGIRAEDMQAHAVEGARADSNAADACDTLLARVEVVEPLGGESLLHLRAANNGAGDDEGAPAFVVRDLGTSGAKLVPGATVQVRVKRERLHLFGTLDEKAVA